MKEKKKSPEKFKQTKIISFCLKPSNEYGENSAVRINRKRKNSDDESERPSKKVATPIFASSSLFPATPEKDVIKKNENEIQNGNDFDNLFDDFENDPFLSPKKKESPKKNVLGNSCTWDANYLERRFEIGFNSPKKCKVTHTFFERKDKFEQVLTVRDEKSQKEGICKLRDVWTSHTFVTDDTVSIHAVESEGNWVVDNKSGYVILYPDIIVSSTALVKSMFCMRQGILSYFFKEGDSESSSRMLIGRLVHELFQQSLKTGSHSNKDLADTVKSLISSRDNLRDIFFSDLSTFQIQKEMEGFIPQIRNFLATYVNKEIQPNGKNFNGTIEDVLDIEELVRSPKLGLQGRIDVTVKMKSKNIESVAPMELKTGKASFSNEHRSQLALYVLLMKELGRKVNSGLLLYLKEGIIEEITPQRDEIRNLFLLRNHFVSYCKSMSSHNLPEPVRHIKSCNKCSFLRICTTYLNAEDGLENHPLRSLEVPDVKPTHVDYFIKWSKMLWLENKQTPDEGEVPLLKLNPNVEQFKDEFKHTFTKNDNGTNRFFRCGTFVHVMDGKSNRICTGQIIEITESTVCVLTEKKLTDLSDTYKIIVFGTKFLNVYLSNLGWLLDKKYEQLRNIIIDGKLPTFEKNLNKRDFQDKCLDKLLNLNRDQQKAILKSLLCKDYLLIKGPPGTGKTQTIVYLIKILLSIGKKVLLAGHTHSSIDNVLFRLNDVEYLRLGSLKSIRKEVHKNSYSKLIENCTAVDDVKKLFDRKLIASTCMGIDADFIQKQKVDVCIVDESSQVLQPEVLRPLLCCEKFILVGDEDQLPPIVRNPEAKKLGMDKSLFESLRTEQATVKLKLQYRMNSVINSLANAIAYNGTIECANDDVAKATMKIPKPEIYNECEEWIVDVLSNDLEKSVVFIDTSEYFKTKKSANNLERCSALEVNIIVKLVTCFLKFGLKSEKIGIITPFWDQIALMKKKINQENLHGIELNTVDQYQGRDKDVILFSCTKENQSERKRSEFELLNDKRRLTVALTRAKHKLIILGDRQTVVNYLPFQNLVAALKEKQFFVLSNGRKNFFWDDYV